jgi:ATP-dependent Clp protease, protease subunit
MDKDNDEITQSMETVEEDTTLVGLLGEIDDDALKNTLGNLLDLCGNTLESSEDSEPKKDIEFVISSGGGNVHHMFAIYDMMNRIKKERDISTYGFGQVASAAVLILAAGTKGKRYISPNTRVLLHNCSSQFVGTTPTITSSFRELNIMESMMISLLSDNSFLPEAEIREMFSKNVDDYFSAEEAIKMGLADKIV